MIFLMCWAAQIDSSYKLKREHRTDPKRQIEESLASSEPSIDQDDVSKDKSMGSEKISLDSQISDVEIMPFDDLRKKNQPNEMIF